MTQIQETTALTATRWECQCDSGGYIRTDDAEEAAAWVADGRSVTAWAQVSGSPWQPIETAPRNGTVIDLWVGGEFAGRRESCYWGLPMHCCGEAGRYCDSDWHDLDNGWVDDFNMPIREELPTHWMPLPAAPVSGQGGA